MAPLTDSHSAFRTWGLITDSGEKGLEMSGHSDSYAQLFEAHIPRDRIIAYPFRVYCVRLERVIPRAGLLLLFH